MLEKQKKRYRRHKKVRAKVFGTSKVPRLCVFRSNKHIYAQLVDDEKGKTILSSGDQEFKKSKTIPQPSRQKLHPHTKIWCGGKEVKKKKIKENQKSLTGKVVVAYEVGKLIAEKALKEKIKEVVFDRGGYKYHGRIKALAEGAREGGLRF